MEIRNSYGGKRVVKAVEHINGILQQSLLGYDPRDQKGLDRKMIELPPFR